MKSLESEEQRVLEEMLHPASGKMNLEADTMFFWAQFMVL